MRFLALSGLIPEQIYDITRFTGYHGTQQIAHYCGYTADYLSQVLEDPSIDGAVYPRSCDSCRVLTGYFADHDTGKFLYQFTVPARQDNIAVHYMAAEIQRYQKAIEQHCHICITDIPERVQKVNLRNRGLKKCYQNIEAISYAAYLDEIHSMLDRPLYEQAVPESLPAKPAGEKRVYLVGSLLTNTRIAASIEAAGMAIYGDNLTQSKRLFSMPETGMEGNIYENIAFSILNNRLSPTQNNFRRILEEDLTEIKKKAIQGVIFITQKYCEPYDYLFAVYKKMLEEQDIPVLRIIMSDSVNLQKEKTALEAFADIL